MEHIERFPDRQLQSHDSILGTAGANLRDLYRQSYESHIGHPLKDGNPVKATLGSALFIGESVFNTFDAAAAGIAGQRLERLPAYSFARTGRNISTVANETLSGIGNLLTLHPIKALGNGLRAGLGVIRAPFDGVLDAGDMTLGFDTDRNIAALRERIANAK